MKIIEVKGTIVSNDDGWIYDWFGYENTTPKKLRKGLEEAAGDDVTIEINSGGGDVFAGNEMYYMINQYKGKTIADIVGFAASCATVVSCGANTVRAVPGMQYMIHNVSCGASGDYHEMDKTSGILQNANTAISNIYRLKTGMSEKELLELMDEETWMEAKRAKELKFIDEIIGDKGTLSGKPFTIHNSAAKLLSDEVKNKIRNEIRNPNGNIQTDSDFLMQKNQLNLLKLRGEIRHEI